MTTCETCGEEIKEGRRFCSMGGGKGQPAGCADEWMHERSQRFGKAVKPPDGVTYGAGKGPRGADSR